MRICSIGAVTLFFVVSAFGAELKVDVSRIIDKLQAGLILGEPVKTPTPRSGEGTDGYYSKCNYYGASGTKSLVIRLHVASASSISAQAQLEMVAATNGGMQSVSGLGDAAQTFSSGGETGAASRLLMLYVVKGNTFIMVGLGGFADDDLALTKAKIVAERILDQI